jgi:hypothetical protein
MVEAPRDLPSQLATPPPERKRRKPPPDWLDTVDHCGPTFRRWPANQPAPRDTKGGKWLIDVDGEPAFAEIAILRALEAEGWEGRWIDNYPLPPTFRTAYWDDAWNSLSRSVADMPLKGHPLEVYRAICGEAGDPSGGGAWDVNAWRGREMVFVEAKRFRSSDGIDEAQLRWLAAGRRLGIPRQCFLFIEWTAV